MKPTRDFRVHSDPKKFQKDIKIDSHKPKLSQTEFPSQSNSYSSTVPPTKEDPKVIFIILN